MESPRRHVPIALPAHPAIRRPRARVTRLTVDLLSGQPVDAMVGIPQDCPDMTKLTLHFVGFNANMGPWEAAKCAVWACATRTIVVMCELPGFSRHRHPLPDDIRHDLLKGDPSSWASLTLAALKSAAEQANVPRPEEISVLAYSTGCSLAAACLPTIQQAYPVSSLTLVEPVSLTDRSLVHLAADNVTDLMRIWRTVPFNYPIPWVRQAARRQTTEPSVHFSLPDFYALITMLASDDTRVRLDDIDLPTTNLARGDLSKLCVGSEFARLDERLGVRGIPGTTCKIAGLGHQFWHCVPAVDATVWASGSWG